MSSISFNPLSANSKIWPNTLKQFVGKLPTNCLSVFGHFDNLALKALKLLSLHKVSQIESCNENSLERFIQYPVKHLKQSFFVKIEGESC